MSDWTDASLDADPRVLFVCTANVCRSPIAEHLMRSKLQARKAHWAVASAGVAARNGQPLPAPTIRVLDESGVRVTTWQTTRLTRELVRTADLVLTADADHRRAAVSLAPDAIGRTFTIVELARLLTLSELQIAANEPGGLAQSLAEAAAVGRGRPQSRGARNADIADPIGRSVTELRHTAERIGDALDEILSAVEFA